MRLVCVLIALTVMTLVGCSSTSKKQYPSLDPIVNKMDVKPLWVKNVGRKSFLESKQFSLGLNKSHIYLADAEGNIKALRKEDGKVSWIKNLDDLVLSGPKADGDILYVSSGEGQLFALDAKTGDMIWKSSLSSEVLSDPAVSDKYLYLQTIDGKIFALNKNTGEKVWVDSREEPALTLRGTSTPLVLNDMVVAGFANGKLTAFDLGIGKRLWETSVSVPSGRTDLQRMVDIDGSIQADSDQIYAASYQGRLSAVAQADGRTTWSRDMSAFSGVKLDGSQIFVADASDHIWSIDKKTGATIWRQDKLEGRDISGVTVLNDSIVVADGAGYIHWLSREDGSFISREYLLDMYNWAYHDFEDDSRQESDFGVSNELKVEDNTLYVRNNMGALSVFQLPVSQTASPALR